MSNRVAGQALRIAAFAGVALAATSLAGCSSLGLGLGGGDVTASTGPTNAIGGQQVMPTALAPIAPQGQTRVAMGPYVPPEDISGGSGGLVTGSAPIATGSVTSSALPPLTGSTPTEFWGQRTMSVKI